MTVALGLVCSDGVLVASDSMASNGTVAMTSRKVRAFDRIPRVWTASGSVFVIEEVGAELSKIDNSGNGAQPLSIFSAPDLDAIRRKLGKPINDAMRAAYARALHVEPGEPGGMTKVPFASSFLVLGYAEGVPWFLEFDFDGQINWHTDRGFYATGSGGPFATVASGLMAHYMDSRPTLEVGKLIAFRTIETTISVSSQGVGLPVQMAVCDADGCRLLDQDELDEIGTGVTRWKQLERESLFVTPEAATEDAVGDLPSMPADGDAA